MTPRRLGRSGLSVSPVGLGAGPLGDLALSDKEADAVVHAALDLGVTFFDTARSYVASEDRLGRALGARRAGVVLATKGGYGAAAHDWTGDAIRLGIDDALGRLRTDVIDVFFLHSCPLGTLQRDDLAAELARAKDAGKVRAAGYSGDGEALLWAIDSGRFDVVECSVSPFDQAALADAVPRASERGVGVVAKRALGNAAFLHREPPARDDVRVYWERQQRMKLDPSPLAWPEAALRFAAFADGITTALVGTTSRTHLEAAVDAVERGPLNPELAERFRSRFDPSWPGLV
jgi:aryl-alcohol dehydrogenase-like predicted oxidoreductase